ncbi:UDP-N-acetylmuramoyl-L-alanyl-D-glutamate--2,6-diaminopimelate ligase [Halobacillus litoralis]|uniref:UDP-N-acetylmuramoyl-L-alanyl-D-glutamate--2, 6-diaminopimelate ligase n=1 Tax=Halobacillus litoralis TaxID=45668 RepID=UPI002491B173|nr:UDP-N-acetylmuramoyl-L-alanyl-D-glutamate--2,6-diaminopimelate ligase [Halobacillus litoralis]
MKLQGLLDILHIDRQLIDRKDLNQELAGVTDDSREVKEGFVFVAVRGYRVDGHNYIEEAISNGASVIVCEEKLDHLSIHFLQTDNCRKALGLIASEFYGNPSFEKIVIGVTGTNGKTTTSHLIKHLCEKNGYSCSMFGTIDYIVNDQAVPGIQTTPSAPVLQRLLAESKDDIVVMEVSSHGLEQYRLEGIAFDYCVFTNLHQDHLDYHSSMENYFSAKSKLFYIMKETGEAVINTDDHWGEKLAEQLTEDSITHETVGRMKTCDYEIIRISPESSSAVISEEKREVTVRSPLKGTHNVYNTLQAYAVGRLLGLTPEKINTALESFQGVCGRFEMYRLENEVTVVIDYAHTADSISHTLETVGSQGAASITHVFGFRGDRDEKKRKDMLEASVHLSDAYILTCDDLNTVPYDQMIETLEMLQSSSGEEHGRIIPDRTLAVEEAIMNSDKGDWVLITGKGHESYQQEFHYPTTSDKETVEYIHSRLKEYEKI